jgi:hypothetical protein
LANTPKAPSSVITVGGGFINYNYMFRSSLDTPFVEQNMGQHMVMAGFDATVADIPVKITYYGRRSNSIYLRDYNDIRVEFNVQEFNRLRQANLRKRLDGILSRIQNPEIVKQLQSYAEQIAGLKRWLNTTELLNSYLESKRNLVYGEKLPDNVGDKQLVITCSRRIVETYEAKQRLLRSFEKVEDSLKELYTTNSAKVQQLRQLINGNMRTSQGADIIAQKLKEQNALDARTEKWLRNLYAVRTFAVGRTLPDMSNLTVKNLNVTGLNVAVNPGKLYLALTAGTIDFRSRDFLYGKPSRVPQYVFAAAAGYGTKEGNHFFVTGYTGKKQIISNSSSGALVLSGLSLQGQWIWKQYLRITAEAAQSTSPVYTSASGGKPSGFNIHDNSNKAYSLQGHGYIPYTQTRIDGYYQRTGINFQNFTNYRVNANASTWNLRAEQYVWKKQLRLQASARKNDYSNPYVVQQYNSNTIFTSFSATFRRRNWPYLTMGYMPSSQYTIVANQVVENRYQTLNITTGHVYRVGNMQANGTFMYSKFYNSGSDTGFVYYNANHFYTAHQFAFPRFAANIGYSRTANSQYSLDVMEGGLLIKYGQFIQAGFGAKINRYNLSEVKTGGYGTLRIMWKTLGDINIWYERSYLPGAASGLKVNEWMTVGFTRYFNNKINVWTKSSR